MKVMRLVIICALALVMASCTQCDDQVIDTFHLVVPSDFHGDIIIFVDQDTTIGEIGFEDCKHFFYVKDDGIFLTTSKVGKGSIKFYDEQLERKSYYSVTHIRDAPPECFQVIGGAYRGARIEGCNEGKEWCRYVIFKAGIAKDIQNNWYVQDSTIRRLYKEVKQGAED